MVDLRPDILQLLKNEPRVTFLTLSAYTDRFCYGCPERLPFTDEVLDDLPTLTHLQGLYLEEIDFRAPTRYAYVRPLKNLNRLEFKKLCRRLARPVHEARPAPEAEDAPSPAVGKPALSAGKEGSSRRSSCCDGRGDAAIR